MIMLKLAYLNYPDFFILPFPLSFQQRRESRPEAPLEFILDLIGGRG